MYITILEKKLIYLKKKKVNIIIVKPIGTGKLCSLFLTDFKKGGGSQFDVNVILYVCYIRFLEDT